MLNSLFAATGLQARVLNTLLCLALLPSAIAIAPPPALAQSSESELPALTVDGLPEVRETTGKWSLPESPPPNIILLPGVTQADIDRVTARPPRPEPDGSASRPSAATAPLQPAIAQDRYFQNRYVRRIPIYQGSRYQAPLAATACSYSPGSTFGYQTFPDLNNRSFPLFPLQGYGGNTVVITERTVTERTFVLNNTGLDRNQVIVSRAQYPQVLGLSNNRNRAFVRRGSNRVNRLVDCEAIDHY